MQSRKNDLDRDEQELVSLVELPRCPDAALLYAVHEGVVTEGKAAEVSAHLEHCEVCRTLFADLEAIGFGTPTELESVAIRKRIEKHAPRAFAPAAEAPWLRRNWWVPAFAMAACAVVAVLLLRTTHTNPPAPQISQVQTPAVPDIPLEKLPIHVDASALLATRGGNNRGPSGPELARALAQYQKDDHVAAAQLLKGLAAKYPEDGTVRLYLGVSELFLGQNDTAASDLAVATKSNEGARLADAQWYLVVADFRLKSVEAALPLLNELCETKNSYTTRACTIQSQLK